MRFLKTGLACAAVLLVASAAGTASSMAVEGPYYKVKGARLNGNKSIFAAIAAEYVIKIKGGPGGEITVKCKEMQFGAGATITGLAAKSSDTSKETFVLKMCNTEGNGSPCNVINAEIKTNNLVDVLAYSEAGRKGEILDLFHPEIGKEIVNLKFTGIGCFVLEGKLEGSFAGEMLTKGRVNILVGGLQAEEFTANIKFPVEPIKKVWIEITGTESQETVGLTFGGSEAKIKGESMEGNINGANEPFSMYTI